MDNKTYPDMLLERFLKTSARRANKTYQLKRCIKLTAIPILSEDEAAAIPASFSFIVEKKDSFASFQIRRKIIGPWLMLLRMKLIEVSPQSSVGSASIKCRRFRRAQKRQNEDFRIS